MFTEDYTDTVIEHFMSPRNAGIINDANGEGTAGDKGCGDYLKIYIKINNNLIENISFMVYGCPASIATSSILTEIVKGKSVEDALKVTEDDIVEALGGLPENKKHCSNLGVKALKNAIDDYYKMDKVK